MIDAGLKARTSVRRPSRHIYGYFRQGDYGMLHIHFGAGRLGLGLVAPFFQKPGSELYLLNRAASGTSPTGTTSLSPGRRNELLRDHPDREYFIQKPAGSPSDRQSVHYDRFV